MGFSSGNELFVYHDIILYLQVIAGGRRSRSVDDDHQAPSEVLFPCGQVR